VVWTVWCGRCPPLQMHVYITRVNHASLSSDSEGISKWCKDAFLGEGERHTTHGVSTAYLGRTHDVQDFMRACVRSCVRVVVT